MFIDRGNETKRWGDDENVTEKDNKYEGLHRSRMEKIKETAEGKRARETFFFK